MLQRTDDALCLICLCTTEGVGPSTVNLLRGAASARNVPLTEILALPRERLEAQVGLPAAGARAVAAIADPLEAARSVLEGLRRVGARVIFAGDREYPHRLQRALGSAAPPVLFLAGEASLLRGPSLAVVGSRTPSQRAAEGAARLALQQAAAGVTVVSGGAYGIDSIAHAAAVSVQSPARAGTVIVPALGVARLLQSGLRGALLREGRWSVLGQFPPQAPWRAAQAIIRNRTIVALADAVVAFEPRDSGGTWHTSMMALRMRKPLFVAAASRQAATNRGLRRLVRLGAVALDPRRMPDAPALVRLIAEYRPSPLPDQTVLFGTGKP